MPRFLRHTLLTILVATALSANAQKTENGIRQTVFQYNGAQFVFSFAPIDTTAFHDMRGKNLATLSGYYIGTTEVTRKQYEAIMGRREQWHESGDDNQGDSSQGDSLPATGLTRSEWQFFIDSINHTFGTEMRMPTPEEWKDAYHGKPISEGYRYAGSNERRWVAHGDNKIHPVAQLIPNELDLYDMEGNAIELVNDEPLNQEIPAKELWRYGMRLVFSSVMNISLDEE